MQKKKKKEDKNIIALVPKNNNVSNDSKESGKINAEISNASSIVDSNENKIEEIQDEEEKNSEIKDDVEPIFSMPIEGEIIKEYAKDKLVYSNTLKEWITHNGIDIKANKKDIVKSAEAGTIKSIKNDPRFGLTVVIDHLAGFSTVYSNLLTAEFVVVGEKVEKGQTIGTVGNTATFEIADEPHLHFEILKDNVQIDPNMYIK